MKYDGFISYSHAADSLLAPRLQEALHKLAKPWYKARALTTFRDETDLSTSPGVWSSIEKALKNARHFILLASPQAALSKWVQQEIDFWIRERDLESLIIVLTEGYLFWDDSKGCFDNKKTDAIPKELAVKYKSEPLYVDLRESFFDGEVSFENPEFKRRIVPIAAKLHNKTPADLISEETREFRRTKRVRNSAIAALAILSCIAVFAAVMANLKAEEAERQRIAAIEAQEEAERDLLRAKSAELRAMLQRVDNLSNQPGSYSGTAQTERLHKERSEILARLQTITSQHQLKLGEVIGFKGNFNFLTQFEGHAKSVKYIGTGLYIDPSTDLALTTVEIIKERYTFILTPDELQAVLDVVGLKGKEARQALISNPVLKRISLQPFDVARLVPDVAEPIWKRIVKRFPMLLEPSIPPEVHTALLSLGFNLGSSNRVWKKMETPIINQNWTEVANIIEETATQAFHLKFPMLIKRRKMEADLIRTIVKFPDMSFLPFPEQQPMKYRGLRVLSLIPLNLAGYVVNDEWASRKRQQINERLAADFTGWEKDNAKFEEQFERVVKALQTEGAREEAPVSRL